MAVLSVFGRLPVNCGIGAVLMFSCLVAAVRPLAAQDMDVPVRVHVPILLKVISFDRHLRARAGSDIVVGVVMQGRNRASVVAGEEAASIMATAGTTVDGIPVRVVVFDLDRQTIQQILATETLTHLYIPPLRAVDIGHLAGHARAARVVTMTGVADYLPRGISVGVGLRAGRPRILVNVGASRAQGADFSAELLKLADLVP